uniref:DUF4939 domain-containing protein n=1 Tax=Naja naja TaxID=35670 RepID=A0A8C6XNU2_NAJNA
VEGGVHRIHRGMTLPPMPQPAPCKNSPTPFKTMFDGTASKLAFFLNRAWSYINTHRDEFHDDAQLVRFLGDNLEEEASEWFIQLNDEGPLRFLTPKNQQGRELWQQDHPSFKMQTMKENHLA